MYLVDKNGEPHDFFEETPFRSSWSRSVLGSGGIWGQQGLLELTRKGEGQSLEYKAWLPTHTDDRKHWEFLQTVVAFANTKGGTILVGVDDDGEITGIEQCLYERYAKELGSDLNRLLERYKRDLIGKSVRSHITLHALGAPRLYGLYPASP